ncbi:MAG: hypothetical protein ACR2RV_11190 [Verrucomicrobiales bacterium]
MKNNLISKWLPIAVSAALLFPTSASADEHDVSGEWTSIIESSEGQTTKGSLSLSQEGSSVEGNHDGGFGNSEIEDGNAEEGAVSFTVTREFGDRRMVTKFAGKSDGKAIRGTMTIDGRDGPREMKWEAYRKPEIDPTGLWKWMSAGGRDGAERSNWVKLKYAKGELTGTYQTERGEIAIKDATLDGKQLSFKVERGFGDRVFASNYNGTLDGAGIKGSIQSRRGDEQRETEWSASRDTPPADPVGTWTWNTRRGRDGQGAESKLTITKEGDSLAGNYSGRSGEASIENPKLEGNVLSFKVTTENDRGTFTSSFHGEIDGDNYEPVVVTSVGDWEMKRSITAERMLPTAEPVGVWKWTNRRRGGEESESALTLKRSDDGQLTGTLKRGDSESTISDVKLEGNDITFSTERTWRDNSFTVHFHGTIRGDEIKGTTQMGDSGASAGAWASFWSANRSE